MKTLLLFIRIYYKMKYILFLLTFIISFFGVTQITANNNVGVKQTSYTNGSSNNSIFIWCGSGNNGSLSFTPTTGTTPYTFNWFQYSTTTFSWTSLTTQTGNSTTINNLSTGGYRVQVYSSTGTLISCDIAWVWNVNNSVTANNTQVSCGSTNLTGTNTITTNPFTYYNPPPPQSLINASTTITVCFTGVHTWVSDLGFYLIGPASCGSPVITLAPNPASICNGGNDFTNLCFTNATAPNFNVCKLTTPLTGTYDSYGGGTGTPINWNPLIGCNAAQGGWRVQVFDCTLLDVGSLTNATVTFSNLTSICGSPTTITYNSGIINSAINDNSCSQATASVYQVPPPSNLTTPIILNGTTTTQWTSNPSVTILNKNNLNTTASNITSQTVFTLTSSFSVGGTVMCVSTAQTTFIPIPLTANFTFTNPLCYNDCNGTATATSTSGTAPYSYVWTPMGNTNTISNLCSGTYDVTITDANGCTVSGGVTLTNPPKTVVGPINHN
jgi:hypothetical protein